MRAAEPLDCAVGGPVRNILIAAAAHPWRYAATRSVIYNLNMAEEIRQAEVLTDEEKQRLFGWGENIFGVAEHEVKLEAERLTFSIVFGWGAGQSCRCPEACGQRQWRAGYGSRSGWRRYRTGGAEERIRLPAHAACGEILGAGVGSGCWPTLLSSEAVGVLRRARLAGSRNLRADRAAERQDCFTSARDGIAACGRRLVIWKY